MVTKCFQTQGLLDGTGEPCPEGKTKCCFTSRKGLQNYQDTCTPIGQNCAEPDNHFDDDYMVTNPIMTSDQDCSKENDKILDPVDPVDTGDDECDYEQDYCDLTPKSASLGILEENEPKCGQRNFSPLPNR